MRIIVRHARDDYIAMLIAQGMENAGANVFSITSDGREKYPNAIEPHTKFVVWAKIENDEMIEKIDKEIQKQLEK